MLEFSTCCFCVPLRIGCLILGYLHLVAASVLTIITILTLTAVGAVVVNSDIQVNQSVVDALIAISVIVLLLLVILLP
ncbi:jg26638, partial [Pararge aegeria aegeria]